MNPRHRFQRIAVVGRAAEGGPNGRIGEACRRIASVAAGFGASVAVEPGLADAAPGLDTVSLDGADVGILVADPA